jgi:hypothetical protein
MKDCEGSEWISVLVRQPDEEDCAKDAGWFLVYRKGFGRACMSRYDLQDLRWRMGAIDSYITHWAYLPRAPV